MPTTRSFKATIGTVLSMAGALLAGASCNENLPVGPNTFAAHLSIVAAHDTLVSGDVNLLTARATDDGGHNIQGLSYTWTTSDATIGALALPTAADTAGQTKNVVGKKTGRINVGLSLPDPRFTSTAAARTQTVVVGGVKVLTTHDSTLTAVNDTGVAIAAGLVRVNGALVTSPSQGVKWTHLGTHVSIVGTGDTLRYIARSNGVDSLIATHDFCLAGAKCADTVITRISQQLSLTLSSHAFNAWSFADSVGPTVRLADRRGNGLAGTSIHLVPLSPLDSAIVLVSGPIGTSIPATGQLASPLLIARANGAARVAVQGVAIDGFSVIVSDTITAAVRQVARHVAVEPLRAVMTANDSIPIKPIARDARGYAIADALIDVLPGGIPLHDIWAGPTTIVGASIIAQIAPLLTGAALPSNNPTAPQIPPSIDISQITLLQRDTAIAGATARTISLTALDSLARPAFGQWVRFGVSFGTPPDSVQLDPAGSAVTAWAPRDTAMLQTLTGLRGTLGGPITLADSAGRIVLRRSVWVNPDVPSPVKSTVEVSAATVAGAGTLTVTIKVKDKFGNTITDAKLTDFVLSSGVGGGTFSAQSCSLGVCTATYTAPAGPGTDTIRVTITAVDVVFSPITITIT